jgi:hypothetical protein
MKKYLRILWKAIGVFAWSAFFCLSVQTLVTAREICLLDQAYTTTADEHGFHYFTVDSGLSGNWMEPFNYYEGTFHFRYEIIDYPSEEPFLLSMCIWSDVKGSWESWRETCSPKLPISGRGVFTTSTTPTEWWQIDEENPVDFARVNDFHKLGIVYWCSSRKNLSDWVAEGKGCWEQANSLLPMEMRVTVVLVAKGYEFSGWE